MSSDNKTEGRDCYLTGDANTRLWFVDQWAIWPRRADQKFTTNIAFLYGGVTAFRAQNLADPEMSADFRTHVNWLDLNEAKFRPGAYPTPMTTQQATTKQGEV